MKSILLFLTVISLATSCMKKDVPPPTNMDNLLVNDSPVARPPLMVTGQVVRAEVIVPDNAVKPSLFWEIGPDPVLAVGSGDYYIDFRTTTPGKYLLKAIDLPANTSRQYTLDFLKADFRYERWDATLKTIEVNEAGVSDRTVGGGGDWGSVTQVLSNGWTKDVAQPGESIGYNFTEGKLTSGTMQYFAMHGTDTQKYAEVYATLKDRMSEYIFTGQFNEWAAISDATLYKEDTARWAEAFPLGYVSFVDHYETPRTYIETRMEFVKFGEPQNSASITIRYIKKV